ncbi:hypothetical protein OOT46_29140 [Aquabacterium sp. A7-Y]|uniref:hypothetical protein n=1 Tax=Aquabacterium sp. A7-Y TaxID=1349605 RepID=UPI00223D72D1|nr:hypothetical protein [Aquabacterium sp. A7-Y]MCW7541867.1 hypothetical protein [Aquabacterium sp. A7-Y]
MNKTNLKPSSADRCGQSLPDAEVEPVMQVLETWAGSTLSWTLLLRAVAAQTGKRYTRQALQRHSRVQLAFALKRATLECKLNSPRVETPELSAALERIARQERTIARLMLENCRLNELLHAQSRANSAP